MLIGYTDIFLCKVYIQIFCSLKKKIVFQFHDVIIVILASVPLRETPSLLHLSSVSRQVLGPLCQGSFSPCAEISFQDQCRMLSQAFYAAIEII